MSTNLTIDRGNTLTKLAVWRGDELVASECFDHDDFPAISAMVERYRPSRAMVCSVAEPATDLVSALTPIVPGGVSMLTHDTPVPLTIGYRTPGTLGVDRIAAAIGAMTVAPGNNLLVIDAGTAVTYDHVTGNGHFAGGNIAPGIAMRLRSLNNFTARLPKVDRNGELPLWGVDTVTAMRSGAVHGVVAETIYYRSQLPDDTVTVIGGGDGQRIASLLPFKAIREPHLVTLGLNTILNSNYQNPEARQAELSRIHP